MNNINGINNDDSEMEELIYPINIHESLKASGGLKGAEKRNMIISFWVFANFIIVWVLSSWLRSVFPNNYLTITILVILVVQLTLGVYVLSFIIDDKGMMNEMNGSELSFTNYFNIYKEHKACDGSVYPFDIIEYADGSYAVFIQCLLGYNTRQRSYNTYDVNVEFEQMLAKSGMAYRKIFSNEKFRGSVAAQQIIDTMKGIDDARLFNAYRSIVMGLMDTAQNESNVLCVTYIIHAKTRIHKEALKELVDKGLMILRKEGTVYREVGVLNYDDTVDFIRRYYKLEVLDMGLVRQHQAVRKKVNCSITVLQLKGKKGVYNTQEYAKLKEELLSQLGIK